MTATSYPIPLMLGDALAILIVTFAGFATHQESLLSTRWLTTFIPLCVAWAVQAPWLGLYRPEILSRPRAAWRAGAAMLLAAPLAGLLRGLLLNTVVVPVFVVVLGLSAALGMLVWRLTYAWIRTKTGKNG